MGEKEKMGSVGETAQKLTVGTVDYFRLFRLK